MKSHHNFFFLYLFFFLFINVSITFAQSVVTLDSLAYRVTKGSAEGKIHFKIIKEDKEKSDFFKISALGKDSVLIEGNNKNALAVGLNHYLKNVAHIHINWNNLSQELPENLPIPEKTIEGSTNIPNRYYLNYCTFSYSMPFWNWERWQQELDWMALHGVNMALSLTGNEVVWKNMLEKLGYSDKEITDFISGPGYFAWWQMNNLEGWGGPLPKSWFQNQELLERKIVKRMRELGIEPIFPGFSGMIPRNAGEKLNFDIIDTGTWCGFPRPSFMKPSDPNFDNISALYYETLNELYGKCNLFAMDPFHEGGSFTGVDLTEVGNSLFKAMKSYNPESKWIIQSWQANPRKELIRDIPKGDLLILDLYSEKVPKWKTPNIYDKHNWVYCMLLNFGGNIGLHGRMNSVLDGFREAKKQKTLSGVGATPEGIENNPVMYELLFDLPWLPDSLDINSWVKDYLTSRYGKTPDENIQKAWKSLINTVYNSPKDYAGEGTVESIICARPSLYPGSASTWGNSNLFYSPDSTKQASALMLKSANKYGNNINFKYDLIDICRQANADEANRLINMFSDYYTNNQKDSAQLYSQLFLDLLLRQDSLLSILPDTHVNKWLEEAQNLGLPDQEAAKLYRKNAAMLITVWGDSIASNEGGLHDYSHREWGGIIKELYYPRWKTFFDYLLNNGTEPDFYKMEKDWVEKNL